MLRSGDIALIETRREMVKKLAGGFSGNSAELDVLLVMISPKSFRNVGGQRDGCGFDLSGEIVPFMYR